MDQLSLGVIARSQKESERRLAIHPRHIERIGAGLRATAAASSMTLGGLLKHLALVEDEYFSHRLAGRDPGPPWDAVDWDADPDWEWHSAAAGSPADRYRPGRCGRRPGRWRSC